MQKIDLLIYSFNIFEIGVPLFYYFILISHSRLLWCMVFVSIVDNWKLFHIKMQIRNLNRLITLFHLPAVQSLYCIQLDYRSPNCTITCDNFVKRIPLNRSSIKEFFELIRKQSILIFDFVTKCGIFQFVRCTGIRCREIQTNNKRSNTNWHSPSNPMINWYFYSNDKIIWSTFMRRSGRLLQNQMNKRTIKHNTNSEYISFHHLDYNPMFNYEPNALLISHLEFNFCIIRFYLTFNKCGAVLWWRVRRLQSLNEWTRNSNVCIAIGDVGIIIKYFFISIHLEIDYFYSRLSHFRGIVAV